MRVADTPGHLAALLTEIAAAGGNVVHVEHDRTAPDLAVHDVEIAVQLETRGPEHAAQLRPSS